MAIIHNWEPNGLHTQYINATSGEQMIASALEISGDPRFDSLHYVIGDWSQSAQSGITAKEVELLAKHIAALCKTNPDILNPSILPKGESAQALVALYVSLTEDLSWKTDWFHTEEEAREWIASH